jgi:hypothetical protein
MFSNYATERVVNALIANPKMAKLGGERREMTVLFSDVVGFTSFSENHTPEEVVTILNEYLGAMTDVIFRWEGTLDKFVGDAIVAFWGAPMRQENHAELAVRCALNMVKRLEDLEKIAMLWPKSEWNSSRKTRLLSSSKTQNREAETRSPEGKSSFGDHRIRGQARADQASPAISERHFTKDRQRLLPGPDQLPRRSGERPGVEDRQGNGLPGLPERKSKPGIGQSSEQMTSGTLDTSNFSHLKETL